MIINKKALSKRLSQRTLLNQKEAAELIDQIFELIADEIGRGNDVIIVGFGKFFSYVHPPRPVRNPKTHEEMILDSYRSLKFKASQVMKKILKEKS